MRCSLRRNESNLSLLDRKLYQEKPMTMADDEIQRTQADKNEYCPPTLGASVEVINVTLFSGTIDPDGGVIGFGD